MPKVPDKYLVSHFMAALFTIENRNNLNALQSKNGYENMAICPVEYSYKDKRNDIICR